MSKPLKTYIKLLFFLSLCIISCTSDDSSINSNPSNSTESKFSGTRFTLLPSSKTNITFSNNLTEGLNTNVLMYEYFYNGGGVAVGDFNGDKLIDIYFTSNMEENKLYLNKGGMQFLDITASSRAGGRSGPWKTGVSIVDINGDNRLDIYLCYSGSLPDQKRMNQLFINQGNDKNNQPLFKDEAAKYGLNSPGFSNQSYFFDYDKDGDLDMLLLNHNPKSLPVLNEVSTIKALAEDDLFRGVRLFKQENERFDDVTLTAGISGSRLTYGLGIGISDLNNDGWPDFYISNDYTIPDYLYINNQDGTFKNKLQESLTYNSHFSMGNDIADFNNDGLQDIITLDMLPEDNERQKLLTAPDNYSKFDLNVRSGFHHQYMRNMLQLNNGDGTFSEIGQLAGVSNTDWSWSALAADYDNDGWKDLYITNGYHRDYANLDFINFMNDFIAEKGRLKRENVLELIEKMPASDVVNYMFSNNKLNFLNTTESWGLNQVSNSNGAAYADLDNDGDLDLIVNNVNKQAFIFQNEKNKNSKNNFLNIKLKGSGKNTQGIGSKVSLYVGDKVQTLEQYTSRGYLSSVSPVLHFGLGEATKADSLIIRWPNGKTEKKQNIIANQTFTLTETMAKSIVKSKPKSKTIFSKVKSPIEYKNPEQNIRDFDRQILLLSELSHQGPCMVKGDFNSDDLDDVFIGGSQGQSASVYLQNKNGTFQKVNNSAFENDKNCEDSDVISFDANGDGRLDLYVASGGYHNISLNDDVLADRLYLNDGNGYFSKNEKAFANHKFSTKGVSVNDDGLAAIFIGGQCEPGRFPESSKSGLLVDGGNGVFVNQINELAPGLQDLGLITDSKWVDVNQDGHKDLVVVGEWLPVTVFVFQDGKFENKTMDFFGSEYKGWWNTIEVADVNKDGRGDLIVGNNGSNNQFNVSKEHPAELFYKDFDENGSVDPIFTYYIQGKSYPYLTRDELLKQLSKFRSKFTSYQSYANAEINDIFTKEELKNIEHLEVNDLETTLFLSTSSNKFEKATLPIEAQYAPVHAISIFDYDNDGNQDLILAGNNSHMKLRIGAMSANYGTLLKGNGKGGFKYISQKESGLKLKGDVKDIIKIGDTLYFGINQKAIEAYKIN